MTVMKPTYNQNVFQISNCEHSISDKSECKEDDIKTVKYIVTSCFL